MDYKHATAICILHPLRLSSKKATFETMYYSRLRLQHASYYTIQIFFTADNYIILLHSTLYLRTTKLASCILQLHVDIIWERMETYLKADIHGSTYRLQRNWL